MESLWLGRTSLLTVVMAFRQHFFLIGSAVVDAGMMSWEEGMPAHTGKPMQSLELAHKHCIVRTSRATPGPCLFPEPCLQAKLFPAPRFIP